MDWTAYKILVYDLWCFSFHLDFSFISHLSNYIYHFIYYLIDIKRFLFQINFSRLQFAHIKDFINQFLENIGSLTDFPSTFGLSRQIITIIIAHIKHSTDSIDRCPDIMAHPLQEFCLRPVRRISLFRCFQKALLILLFFFLFYFKNVFL